MKVHVYDFRWKDEHTFEFQASDGHRFGFKKLSLGDRISLSIESDTECAGSRRDSEWKPCVEKVMGKKKCEACRNREGNFVITSFDGFNSDSFSPQDLARLAGDHWVYFALFDKHCTKVGVSKFERKTLRQIEQGAHQTLYIAKTKNGVQARQIETCFRNAGMSDKIQSSTKKEFLCPEFTPEQGQEFLCKLLENHKSCLSHFVQLQSFLLTEIDFVDWSELYGLNKIKHNLKHFHNVKLEKGESVSGRIAAVKGPFLIIETDAELVSLCAKDLLGRWIDFTEKPEGLSLNAALQNTLF